MAPKKNKKGNKKGGSGLSSPTPGFSASSSKAPEDLTIGTTGEAFSKTSPKSPESKIPIITTPATPRSPPGSADLKGSKDKLAIPTSPPKKLFAPLGDGELTPKPLKFGKNDSSDTTPKPSAFGDKNPYGAAESLSNLGEAARVGDDFAPQEPLQVMMATDGGEGGSGGDKGKGNGKGKQPEGGGSPKHPKRSSSLFEGPYARNTVVTGAPQVMGATGDDEIRPRTPTDEKQRNILASAKAAGKGPKTPIDPAGGGGGKNPGLFEPAYPRTTKITGRPQVMGATDNGEIRPRTPPPVRHARDAAELAAAAGGNGGAGGAGGNGGPGNNGGGGSGDGNGQSGSGNEPKTPKQSIFYPIQPMQPKSSTPPRVMGDGKGPVRPRTPPQDRQRLWREEQAADAAAAGGTGNTGNDGTDDSNPPPAATTFEPMRPEEPKPKKKPQVLGVADPNDVPPRTPRNERDEREATRLATEAAQRAADAEASKTPKEPSDEPTGGTGGNSTPPKALTDQGTPPDPNKQKPEFSKLFAPPAPRRFLGADGRIPAHIANAPVMGRDPPPPRESRLQRKRRVKAEKEAMIKQLEDEGRDVQAILAQTEGVPDLLAFPLTTDEQDAFEDYAEDPENKEKECVKLGMAALEAENDAQMKMVAESFKLQNLVKQSGKALAAAEKALRACMDNPDKSKREGRDEISDLKAEVKRLEAEVARLTAELDPDIKKRMDRYRRQRNEYETERDDFERERDECLTHRQNIQVALDAGQQDKADLETQVNALLAAAQAGNPDQTQQLDNANAEIADLKEKLAAEKKKNEKLKADKFGPDMISKEDYDKEKEDLDNENKKIGTQIEAARIKEFNYIRDAAQLAKELKQAQKAANKAGRSTSDSGDNGLPLPDQIVEIGNRLKAYKREVDSLQASLTARGIPTDAKILRDAQARVTELEAEVTQLKATIKVLRKRPNTNVEAHASEMAQSREKISELEAQLKDCQAGNGSAKLINDLELAEESIRALERQMTDINNARVAAINDGERKEEKAKTDAQKYYEDRWVGPAKDSLRLKAAQEAGQRLEHQLEGARTLATNAQRASRGCEAEKKRLNTQIEQLEARITDLQNQGYGGSGTAEPADIEQLRAALREAKSQKQGAELRYDAAAREITRLKALNSDQGNNPNAGTAPVPPAPANVADLERQLATAQRELDKANADCNFDKGNLNTTIRELREDITKLKERIAAKDKQIRDFEGEVGRPENPDRGNNEPPTYQGVDFAILRTEVALQRMVAERGIYGFIAGDNEPAIRAAREATRLADRARLPNDPDAQDGRLMGRAYFWLGVAVYYGGDTQGAEAHFDIAQGYSEWLEPKREQKWLQNWLSTVNLSIDVAKKKEDYWTVDFLKNNPIQNQGGQRNPRRGQRRGRGRRT